MLYATINKFNINLQLLNYNSIRILKFNMLVVMEAIEMYLVLCYLTMYRTMCVVKCVRSGYLYSLLYIIYSFVIMLHTNFILRKQLV